MNHISARRGLRALTRLLLAGAFALPLAGCDTDEIVRVEDPEELAPEATDNAAAVPAIVTGAFRQFVGGYSGLGGGGSEDAFLTASGVISDEFAWGDSFTTRRAADRRVLNTPNLTNISDVAFARLHQSRVLANRALAMIDKFEDDLDDPEGMRTVLKTTQGYVYVTLSEGWCSAVPFSNPPAEGEIDPKEIVYGPAQTTTQMNETAVQLFDEALVIDPSSDLARIGKARALQNLGRYNEAEAEVAAVPTTFVFHLEHSTNTTTQNNPIAASMDNGRYTISNLEGGTTATGTALNPSTNTSATNATAEGYNYRSAQDPRLPYQTDGACFTSSVQCYQYNNYPNLTSDVVLASGVEARLIEAEAAHRRGDFVTALSKLNALRANAPALLRVLYPEQIQTFPSAPASFTMAPLVDPITDAARRDMLFKERAFWLYATGHRQGDLRRLVRHYGLTTAQAFPSGPYFRTAGLNYGNDVAYPVPFNEENNPDFDPALCVTTSAGN